MYPAFTKYFDDSLTNYYPHDVQKAKELLSEAGYPDGFTMEPSCSRSPSEKYAPVSVLCSSLISSIKSPRFFSPAYCRRFSLRIMAVC